MTSNWNRRFFYVDPYTKRLGYKASRGVSKFKAFIFLDDITGVKSFDDMNFQVSSPKRNFFLRADSQASAAAWVKELENYRLDKITYDKENLKAKISEQLKKKKSREEESDESEDEEKEKKKVERHIERKKKSKQRIIRERRREIPEEKSELSTRTDTTVEEEDFY